MRSPDVHWGAQVSTEGPRSPLRRLAHSVFLSRMVVLHHFDQAVSWPSFTSGSSLLTYSSQGSKMTYKCEKKLRLDGEADGQQMSSRRLPDFSVDSGIWLFDSFKGFWLITQWEGFQPLCILCLSLGVEKDFGCFSLKETVANGQDLYVEFTPCDGNISTSTQWYCRVSLCFTVGHCCIQTWKITMLWQNWWII